MPNDPNIYDNLPDEAPTSTAPAQQSVLYNNLPDEAPQAAPAHGLYDDLPDEPSPTPKAPRMTDVTPRPVQTEPPKDDSDYLGKNSLLDSFNFGRAFLKAMYGTESGLENTARAGLKLFGGQSDTLDRMHQLTEQQLKSIGVDNDSLGDIHSVGDFGNYVSAKIGELVPTLAMASVGGSLGGFLGTAAPFVATGIGEEYENIQRDTGEQAPGTAIVAGTAKGLLMSLPVGNWLEGIFKAGTPELKEFVWKNVVSDTIKEIPKAALQHGASFAAVSGAGEVLHQIADKVADSNYNLLTKDNWQKVLGATLEGAATGAMLGVAGKPVEIFGKNSAGDAQYKAAGQQAADIAVEAARKAALSNENGNSETEPTEPVPGTLPTEAKPTEGLPTPEAVSVAPLATPSNQNPLVEQANEQPVGAVVPKESTETFGGLKLTVEYPAGSVRSGQDAAGNPWQVKMPADYGRIQRAEGGDGEPFDFYLGPDKSSHAVYLIDQKDPSTGGHDEQKAMLGFASQEAATAAYDAAFSDGSGPSRRAAVTAMTLDNFKSWLKNGDQSKPFAPIPPEVTSLGEATPTAQGEKENASGLPTVAEKSATASPEPLQKGDAVTTANYGPGKVVADMGNRVSVELESGQKIGVAKSDVTKAPEVTPPEETPQNKADALLNSISFDSSTLVKSGEEIKGGRGGNRTARPAFWDSFGEVDPTTYSKELGEMLTDGARTGAQEGVGRQKGEKKTAGNNDNKNLTHRVVFLENQDTAEIVGVGISRNRGIYVGILPGEKSGMTLEQAMSDGWIPVASARVELPFLRTDPKATVKFTDAAEFEELVGQPAKDKIASTRAQAEMTAAKMRRTAGAEGPEIVADHGETSTAAVPEEAPEHHDLLGEFASIVVDGLPRGKDGKVISNLSPTHIAESIMEATERPEDMPSVLAAFKEVLSDILASKSKLQFEQMNPVSQQKFLLDYTAKRLYDRYIQANRDVDILGRSLSLRAEGTSENANTGLPKSGVTSAQGNERAVERQIGVQPSPETGVSAEQVEASNGGTGGNAEKLQQAQVLTDPSVINSKTWYHGTGTKGLTPTDFDPFVGSHESLFGQGIYLTDSQKMAEGYAGARGRKTGDRALYDVRVKVDRVLDLEQPASQEIRDVVKKIADQTDNNFQGDEAGASVDKALKNKSATTEQLFGALKEGIKDLSHSAMIPTSEFVETFQEFTVALREMGYDALTHTGGKRTGNEPHRVLILLDPNDAYSGVGRKGQITAVNDVIDAATQRNAEVLKQSGVTGIRVVDDLNESGRPAASSYLAIPDGQGGILFSRPALEEVRQMFKGDTKGFNAFIDAVIAEEAIHSVGERTLSQQEVEQVWSTLTDKQKAAVIETYFGKAATESETGFTPYQLGHEFIRQFLQDKMFGTITERLRPDAVPRGVFDRISDFAKSVIGKALMAFRNLVGQTTVADDAIAKVERALNLPPVEGVKPTGEAPAALVTKPEAAEEELRNRVDLAAEDEKTIALSTQVQNEWTQAPEIRGILDRMSPAVADNLSDIFGDRVEALKKAQELSGPTNTPLTHILQDKSLPEETRTAIAFDAFKNVWDADLKVKARTMEAQKIIEASKARANSMSSDKAELVDQRKDIRVAIQSAVTDYQNMLVTRMQAEGNLNRAEALAYALKQVEGIKTSSTALERVLESMTADPTINELLKSNPNATAAEIAAAYSSTPHEIGLSGDAMAQATSIFAADHNLADKLIALKLTTNPATRADIENLLVEMRNQVGKGVVGDFGAMLKKYGSLKGQDAIIQKAILRINPKLKRAWESAKSWSDTAKTLEEFQNSKAWRDIRTEAYSAFNAQSSEKTYDGATKINFINPLDGSTVSIVSSLDGAFARENLAKLTKLFDDAKTYLLHPEAPGYDPARASMWKYQIDNAEGYWLNPQTNPFSPHPVPRILDLPSFLQDPKKILENIGGPREVGEVMAKLQARAHAEKMIRELESGHGIRVDNLNRTAAREAGLSLEDWFAQVSNDIAGHAQFAGQVPLKIGDKTLSGHTVNARDMAAIKAQKDYTDSQRDIAENGKGVASLAIEPARVKIEGGFRKAGPTSLSELTLPSKYSNRAKEWYRDWQQQNTLEKKIAWLNKPQFFRDVLMGHFDTSQTPFYRVSSEYRKDYRQFVKDLKNGDAPDTLQGIATEIFDHLSTEAKEKTSIDGVASKIVGEIDRVMQNFGKDLTDSTERNQPGAQISVFSGDNSFTKPRAEAPAYPHTFLDYGAMDKSDRIGLAHNAIAPYQIELIGKGGALDRMSEAFGNAIKNEENKLKEFAGSKSDFNKMSSEAVKRGDQFYDLQQLRIAKARIDHLIKNEKATPTVSNPAAAKALARYKDLLGVSILWSPLARVTHTGGNMLLWGEWNKRIDNALVIPAARHLVHIAKTAMIDMVERADAVTKKLFHSQAETILPIFADNIIARRNEVTRLRELGLIGDYELTEQFKSFQHDWKEMFKTYGQDSFGKHLGNVAISGVDLLSQLVRSQPFHSRYNDTLLNSRVVAERTALVDRLRANAVDYLSQRAATGIPATVELTPQELTGNRGATSDQASFLRSQFSSVGMNLDHLMSRYHAAYEQAKSSGQTVSDVPFLTDGEAAALDFSILQQTGLTTSSTRNYLGKNSLVGSALNYIHGLPVWSVNKYLDVLTKMSDKSLPQNTLRALAVGIPVALYAMALGLTRQVTNKALTKELYNQSSSLPTLLTVQTPSDYAKVMIRALSSWVPIAGDIMNGVVLNTPDRFGNLDSQFVLWNFATDLMKTAGNVIKSGNLADPTEAMIRRWVPTAKIVTNRLPSEEGKVQYFNAGADIRSATPDTMEQKSRQAGQQYTPSVVTPMVMDMVNSAFRGDQQGFTKAYNAAVAAKTAELDKLKPNHPGNADAAQTAVRNAFAARNIWLQNFRTLPTQAERELIISRMDADQKAEVQKAEQVFAEFGQLLGANVHLTAEESSASHSGGGSRGAGGPSIGSGGSMATGGSSGGSEASAPKMYASRLASHRPRVSASRLRRPRIRIARPRLTRHA